MAKCLLGEEPLNVSVWRSSERKGLLTDNNGGAALTPEACPCVEDSGRRKENCHQEFFFLFKLSKCLTVRLQRISKRYSFKKTFRLSQHFAERSPNVTSEHLPRTRSSSWLVFPQKTQRTSG